MLKQINEIDANSQIIIKYEDFIKKPFSIIKKCYKKLDIPYKTYDEQFNNIIKSSSYKQFFKSIEIDEINNAISGTLKRLGY
jgi:ppGpp synthetase/RelA/SpoT-type nucleotidyltranferase